MVSHDAEHLQQALQLITSIRGAAAAAADAAAAGEAAAAAEAGLVAPGTIAQLSYACPWCGLSGLTGPELWLHQPLYHIYEVRGQGARQFTQPTQDDQNARGSRGVAA